MSSLPKTVSQLPLLPHIYSNYQYFPLIGALSKLEAMVNAVKRKKKITQDSHLSSLLSPPSLLPTPSITCPSGVGEGSMYTGPRRLTCFSFRSRAATGQRALFFPHDQLLSKAWSPQLLPSASFLQTSKLVINSPSS